MTAARSRVQVDRNLCEGHALCVELAADLLEAAVAACPRRAISIVKGPQE
ncbi:hypothetical protein H7J51_23670 [Mycobacterium crocinum]|uniref:Ferredoxin n=1 Tax=Mycolicibacterium crocinum TaxID=388459 RepID=A0ABY3TTR1_9MYCO|nr:hypothetical protein [Mycolicibacterium crocinum]MCV7218270.1 hypothetical protein [Mycolicibacterium crocinum]ULN43463.1 hypothetical protein MI149_10575 [Mycolicibacterium crocinum]